MEVGRILETTKNTFLKDRGFNVLACSRVQT